MIFSHENAVEDAVCKVSAIVSQPQYIKEFRLNMYTVYIYHIYIDS